MCEGQGQEATNGRYLRLVTKLALVNERADENGGLAWSDTGERYILRLFRDFVFHQKGESGENVVDLGHVLDALAKLDVGAGETIPLCSPDGKTLLVCSYEDVRRCLENAYGELVGGGAFAGEKALFAGYTVGGGVSPLEFAASYAPQGDARPFTPLWERR